ncbi:hypothetical protein HMN09_00261200 [Mycena chlorophos]|uniref:Uncharacterized protein n=1 Tax=Mycena chlorophos TaxID=658473 RepID=A0A8H6TK61_MYCCL|nr:hypothetical protein HMN09_00261200 [Mycena chlorophos]
MLGGALAGVQFALEEINPYDGVVDPAPLFSTELAVLPVKAVADQLGNLALFPTLPPQNPPAATALTDLATGLSGVQTLLANITIGGPALTTVLGNNTQALAEAKRNLKMALAVAGNLGCTVNSS